MEITVRYRPYLILGAAAVVGSSVFAGMGALRVSAAFVSSGTVQTVNQTSPAGSAATNLNPLTSQNDQTATPDPASPYTNIDSFTVNKGSAPTSPIAGVGSVAPGFGNMLQINLNLLAPVPKVPFTNSSDKRIDAQLEYTYCLDPKPSSLASGAGLGADGAAGVVNTGFGANGGPVFDGPYPTRAQAPTDSDGYKYCAWVDATPAPNGVGANCDPATLNGTDWQDACTWGVEFSDPVQNFTFIQNANMYWQDAGTNPGGSINPTSNCANTGPAVAPVQTILPPSINGTSVTFYFPYNWGTYIPAPPNSSAGCALNFSETVLTPGETVANGVAQVWTQAEAQTPVPTCVPPVDLPQFPACSIAGNVQGVVGLLFLADFAPGQITPAGPVGAVGGPSYGYDLGAAPANYPYGAVTEPCDPTGAASSVTDDRCVQIQNSWNYAFCQPTNSWGPAGSYGGQNPTWNPLPPPTGTVAKPAPAAGGPTYQDTGSIYSLLASLPAVGPTVAPLVCGTLATLGISSEPENGLYVGGANTGDTPFGLFNSPFYGRLIPETKTVNPSFYDVAQYTQQSGVGSSYVV